MQQKEKQLITIKGTKEGLIFYVDDSSSFQDIYVEMENVLSSTFSQEKEEDKVVSVILQFGYRYVTDEQKSKLKMLIETNDHFTVERFESEVICKQQAMEWLDKNQLKSVRQIVRSGQVLNIKGDLLLVGDVNPGGEVRATGDIFIMGNLHGIAHAGFEGNEDAVIAASYMNPSQLRIAKYISRSPDYESEGVYMECGYLDKENKKIVIDRLQVLPYVQNKLRKIEGGIHDG